MNQAIKSALTGLAMATVATYASSTELQDPFYVEPGVLQVGQADEEFVSFDLEALDALPQVSFETSTIWTDGSSLYSGVSVATLLEEAGMGEMMGQSGATLELVALNDYRVQIPIEDIGEELPIVATRIDGETVSIREKGPYWLIYPFDRAAEYRTEETYKRSIWQLAQMIVLE